LKYILGILCIGMFIGSVCAESITVSRDMPETATLGSEVTVNLKLNVVGGETSGVILTEKIPGGLSVSSISNEGSFDSETGEIKWLLYGENIEPQTLSYTCTAPSEAGEYTFSGTYTTLEEGVGEITGDERITVGVAEKPIVNGPGYMGVIIIGIAAVIAIIVLIFILAKRKK